MSKKKYFQGYRKLLVDNFIKSIATFRTQWDRSIIILLLENGEWDCRRRDSDRVKCCCWPPSGKLKCQNQWLLCNNDSITYTSAWNALSIHRSVQSSADGLSHVVVIYYDMRFCWPIFCMYICIWNWKVPGKIYYCFPIFWSKMNSLITVFFVMIFENKFDIMILVHSTNKIGLYSFFYLG